MYKIVQNNFLGDKPLFFIQARSWYVIANVMGCGVFVILDSHKCIFKLFISHFIDSYSQFYY